MSSRPREKTLYKKHPAMFGNNPILFLIALAAILFYGVGFIILILWWFKASSETLTVTTRRVIYKKGFLGGDEIEMMNSDITTIRVNQSFFQQIFSVGNISMGGSATAQYEINVSGIPVPHKVKQLINANK